MDGLKNGDLNLIKTSKLIFPFEREFLVAEALSNIRAKVFNNDAYLILKEALRYDPNSAEMLGIYIQYEFSYGNKELARVSLNRLNKIAPNSQIVKIIAERFKEQ